MKAQSELTGDRKRRVETTRPCRKAEQQIWIPIEGETSELYKAQHMIGKSSHSTVGDACTDICTQLRSLGTAFGTFKNEVNHCPAAQQWAGLHSVNSANVCLCGIFGVVCIIFQHLQNVKEVIIHGILATSFRFD